MLRQDFNNPTNDGQTFMSGSGQLPTQALGTIPRFYMDTVVDGMASREAGSLVYKQVEMVLILFAGSNNQSVRRKVLDHDKRFYSAAYELFKRNESQEDHIEGTPLSQWPGINRAQAETMRHMNIHSVEQLANLSDAQVMDLGMGGNSMRAKAIDFLQVRSGTADQLALMQQVRDMQAQMASLQAANKDMSERLAASTRAVQLASDIARHDLSPAQIEQSYVPTADDRPTDPLMDAMLAQANGLEVKNLQAAAAVQASFDERSGAKRGRPPKAEGEAPSLAINQKLIE